MSLYTPIPGEGCGMAADRLTPLSPVSIIRGFRNFRVGATSTMYAVIQTGGKQYRVKEGDILKIETLPVEAGQELAFDKVLMVQADDQIKVGRPFLEGGKVTAVVKAHGRHPKIRIIKFRRRKHYMRRTGHRQNYIEVQITGISA